MFSWRDERELFDAVLYVFYLVPLTAWILTCLIKAPYGKFQWQTTRCLNIPGKLGWPLMEIFSPAIFLVGLLVPPADRNLSTTELLLVTLWLLHYTNRVFVYTYRAPSIAPVHAATIVSGAAFNCMNAYVNSRWIAVYGRYSECGYRSPRFVIGMLVFAVGMWINCYHDDILFSLRRSRRMGKGVGVGKGGPPWRGYAIPRGGLFEYVSCPSYFGETIEWVGFAIAAWYSEPAILFALTTPANLFPRARITHKWYKETFREVYPSSRKAIVPFLL